VRVWLLTWFGRLPEPVRNFLVRRAVPAFTVGTVACIERDDGAVLLVTQPYRRGWGLPGGFLRRGEDAEAAAHREVREELGVELVITGPPAVVVDPNGRRVDVVFPARLADGAIPRAASAEVVDIRWHSPAAVADLQEETAAQLAALARSRV
jgi:ADP-ribose pyrophosphatase YjhB (NUDIX family)